MDCSRSEVSGRRLWGWAEARFGEPDRFFRRFLVLNYCPLAFFDADGRNITPDRLPAAQRKPLLDLCDEALREWTRCYRPRHVVGVGRFAARRAEVALDGMTVTVGCITHPSPANPKANRDWSGRIESEFRAMGIEL
jgi:single-strand selective monofunctional uracil DNA glycosylase